MKLSDTELDTIKLFIDEFCEEAYGCKGEYKDLLNVPLAYTIDEDTDEEIQVIADLENGNLIRYRDGQIECQILYDSYEEMRLDFAYIDFGWLIYDKWEPVKA